jgi:hypothetical protein
LFLHFFWVLALPKANPWIPITQHHRLHQMNHQLVNQQLPLKLLAQTWLHAWVLMLVTLPLKAPNHVSGRIPAWALAVRLNPVSKPSRLVTPWS